MKWSVILLLSIGLCGCGPSGGGDPGNASAAEIQETGAVAAPAGPAGPAVKIAPADWDWGTAKDEWSSSAEFASSKALCRQVIHSEPPAEDAPDAATAATLKDCSSEALYYGIGMKADPVKARQCAFIEIAEKRDDAPFSGRTMLMTLYANGVGARRDFDIATHLACGVDGAAAESHARVTHLAELKAKKWSGTDFSFCDDITSGLAGGYCASHEADIAGAERNDQFAAVTRGWTQAEKQAFERLKKAHAAFASAHSEGEIDLSGTLRGAMAVEAEEALNDELLKMIEALQAGKAPSYTAEQLKAADAALNQAYREYLASDAVGGDYPGAVTKDGVRDAQRAWIAYRDAFVAFAAVKYPRVSRDSIAAWVTNNRSRMWTEPGE